MKNDQCSQGKRCKNHRKCEQCAIIRAYKFSQQAHQGIPENAEITYTVIRPDNEQDIIPIKRKMTRWSARNSIGHCWTIETGHTAYGLHLNIILAGTAEIKESEIIKAVGTSADIWASRIKKPDFEKIARYIAKAKSIPSKKDYAGRTMGRSGCMRNPIDFLARQSGGVANLVAQECRLKKVGLPESEYQSNHHTLKHLPAVARAVSRPHDYEPFAVDNNGDVVNNPRYIPPQNEYPDIRDGWKNN